MNRKIKVLHFMTDDKFFDSVFNKFEEDARLINEGVFLAPSKHYQFKTITNKERITIYWDKKTLRRRLLQDDYDVIFFQPLLPPFWSEVKYIPLDKVVIWWGFGGELYNRQYGNRSLISVSMYKPLTHKIMLCNKRYLLGVAMDYLKGILYKPNFSRDIKMMLERIDYFQPVLECEYELMQRNTRFQAKEFYYPNSRLSVDYISQKSAVGSILCGNSATYTNNHLDVFLSIKGKIPEGCKLIVPLSYGDSSCVNKIIEYIEETKINAQILQDFIPKEEYFKVMNSCSYFIMGALRQQGIGNVLYALRNGIKLFLYKDSIVYKFLKSKGFYVYTIEDIDKNSFCIPLTEQQNAHHMQLLNKEVERRKKKYEDSLAEIIKKLESKMIEK